MHSMIKQWLCLVFLLVISITSVSAKTEAQEVVVADPYIELHTGPGEAYPIFHVVERGEKIGISIRKTEWFKVEAANQPVGWVHRNQLEKTLSAEGDEIRLTDLGLSDYEQRRWEFGMLAGDFEGAPTLGVFVGYVFNQSLSSELSYTQATGNFSSSMIVNANLLSYGEDIWRIKPFFTLGAGWLKTEPRSTLVQSIDRDDFTAHVGLGLQAHLDKQFVLRVEYKNYVVFSSDDNNEDPEEWKAGFVVFFK